MRKIAIFFSLILRNLNTLLKSESVSRSVMSNNPRDCSRPGSSIYGISQVRILQWVNIQVGKHSLPWGIFPIQGLNPGLQHCRQILYQLSHKGSPQGNVLKRQIYKYRKQINGCLGLGSEPNLQAGTGKLGGSGEMYSIIGLGNGYPTFHIY